MKHPKIRTREERLLNVELERRDGDENPLRIVGHPVVYNRWSEDLGGFRERVLPGAATKTLTEADIRVLLNHDPNFVLGRNVSKTATFLDEPRALRMECFPPDTQTVRDLVITPMERGDINQMSFSFRAIADEWREPPKVGGLWERSISEFQMYDASIVTFPAYTQTDAHVRMGLLASAGVDMPALAALLTRAERGLPLLDADVDLLNGSIEALRSYLPEPEPASGDHSDEPQAGRDVDHLRRLLDLGARQQLLDPI